MSADGAFIAFNSKATNLVPGQIDTNGDYDAFLYERATGAVTLISHVPGSMTTTGNAIAAHTPHWPPYQSPVISADGSYVAFVY